MIRAGHPAPDLTATTDEAHVRTVAEDCGLPVVAAGEWLYCVRRTPLFGQPIVYRCRVEVRHG